ncbi:hypothetical protein [Bosea sp. (in: a-proteobacteria)]|uniref:hypothetical protein n=1 Tax=Bosea sp. (in: a-proteobacteria) TaxID=1871050 RepID=UPI003B3A05CD
MSRIVVEPIKNPRRIGKHVAATLDYLRELGCEGVEVIKRKHLTISWAWGAGRLSISAPCTPRDQDQAANYMRQGIRRAMREAAGR